MTTTIISSMSVNPCVFLRRCFMRFLPQQVADQPTRRAYSSVFAVANPGRARRR
jgi:hypothetical protein